MAATMQHELTGIDAEFGYEFGCDGVMNSKTFCELLDVSRHTLDRMHEDKQIRKGKTPEGRIIVCKRSVKEFLSKLEV